MTATPERTEPTSTHPRLMTRPIHVLHVDDNAALRDLTAEFLEKVAAEITVHSVADPTEVPATLAGEEIDCVVSDYEMPEQDGLDLCHQVRDDHPDLPFFLFTSRGGEEIVGRAMDAGATDYIQKEPGVEQYTLLANRIANAVSRHRTEERLAELEQAVDEQAAADGGVTPEDDDPSTDDVEVVREAESEAVGGVEF